MNHAPESVSSKTVGRRSGAMENFSRYHALAIEMAVAVVAPVLAGRWLDTKTGKDPWFTIAGVVLGGAAAMRSAQRAIGESRRALENGDKPSDAESSE